MATSIKHNNPRCPYCGMDPLAFDSMRVKINSWEADAIIFSCSNKKCRKTISIQILSIEEAREDDEPTANRFKH